MPQTIEDSSLSGTLRTTTRQEHVDVEDTLLPFLTSLNSKHKYASLLRMFFGFYQPLEQRISAQLSVADLPDLPERRKSSAILSDLAQCGMTSENIPLCSHLPSLPSKAAAFGALYVLEGSTLGGKMIARMLLENKELSVGPEAVSFFSGYGAATGARWRVFLEALNQQADTSEVVAAARQTFIDLKAWMQSAICHE
jgi:heme oxygenase